MVLLLNNGKNCYSVFQREQCSRRNFYLHSPSFCEQLCTFCACHKRITKQHSVETPYLESVLKNGICILIFSKQSESAISRRRKPKLKAKLKELHFGGGTPTFFSAENLRILLEGILAP